MRQRFSLLLSMVFLLLLCGCAAQQVRLDVQPQTADVNGVRLGYRIFGSGDPLLLITGYAATMDVWDAAMVTELAKLRTVILFDNRGMGYSGINDAPLTMGLMASDAVGMLDALGIEQADVMGWSMGSTIAQEMALAHPDRVGKLILYATAVDAAPIKKALDGMALLSHEQFLARLFPDAWRELHPDIYSRLPSPAVAPAPSVIRRQYKALTDWPGTRERLPRLDKDTLVVVGLADRITPPEQSLAAVALIKRAWLARFTGAGHWLMYQAGKELALTVEHFLDGRANLLLQ